MAGYRADGAVRVIRVPRFVCVMFLWVLLFGDVFHAPMVNFHVTSVKLN
jgi:hypothetical protein